MSRYVILLLLSLMCFASSAQNSTQNKSQNFSNFYAYNDNQFLAQSYYAQYIPFAFWKRNYVDTNYPCNGTPSLGTVCTGGAIYAGEFDGGKYMVTPGDCTDSATPTCDGTTDTLQKRWRGTSGSSADLSIENITDRTIPSSSAYRGHVTTPVIVAAPSIDSDSAADYCSDMAYGGYSDWYLPSKSEMAYIYCHTSVASHDTDYPNEDPDCTNYGGKTSELTNFANGIYWTSTEDSSSDARTQHFTTGWQGGTTKGDNYYIRCVRRYGASTSSGLIHHYKLDELAGLTASDSVGTIDGTLSGPAWVPAGGSIDGALDFDGSNDSVSISNTGDVFETAPFSYSMWVKLDTLPSVAGSSHTLFMVNSTVSPWNSVTLRVDQSDDQFRYVVTQSNSTYHNLSSDNALEVDRWYHVVVTLNASYDMRMYVDGVLQAGTANSVDIYNANSNLALGADVVGTTNYHDGLIDDFRFYNTVLSASEISDLYNEGNNQPARNYFVMTNGTWNGDLGGLAGADAKCLSDLQNYDWKGKAGVALNSTTVKAFLCESDGAGACNDPPANTTFAFARSGSTTAGGATFTTDASGRGPGDNANWSDAAYFDSTNIYWTNRRNDSGTLWNDEGDWNYCNGWVNGTGSYSGEHGTPNTTNQSRWTDGSVLCSESHRLVCMVTDNHTTASNGDPYGSNVVLLIQPDADDTVPVDLSFSTHTVNTSNGTALSTAVADPFGGSNQVIVFDGNDNRLSMPDSDDWYWDGDFTVEMWVYFLDNGASQNSQLFFHMEGGWSQYFGMGFDNSGNIGANFEKNTSGGSYSFTQGSDNTASENSWHHLAVTRSGNDYKIFEDGTQIASGTSAFTISNITSDFHLGSDGSGSFWTLDGYIGSARITKGVARYTSNFTPPSEAFPIPSLPPTPPPPTPTHRYTFDEGSGTTAADSVGSLDGTLTNGPTWVASGGQLGDGSVNFDGGDDYVALVDDAEWTMSSGKTFTYAAWFKMNAAPGGSAAVLVGDPANNFTWYLFGNAGSVTTSWYDGSLDYTSPALNLQVGVWYHLAISVELGGSSHQYLNGVEVHSFTPNNFSFNPTYLALSPAAFPFDGEIDDVQIFDQTITASQAAQLYNQGIAANDPYESNVVLLIQPDTDDVTPADLSDSAHTITENGGADLNTSISDPFGGSNQVIHFDSNNQTLTVPDSDDFHFGSGDLTIETWVYNVDFDADANFIYGSQSDSGGSESFFSFGVNNPSWTGHFFGYSVHPGPPTFDEYEASDRLTPDAQWIHVAWVRKGNEWDLYVDGQSTINGTHSNTINNFDGDWFFGATEATGTVDIYMWGYRITKGVARYTTDFSPPTAAFPFSPPTPSMTHHYEMDESAGTTAVDSIAAVNGTLMNGTSLNPGGGVFDGGYSLDGNNDYVRINGSAGDFDHLPITYSVWFKIDTLPSPSGGYPRILVVEASSDTVINVEVSQTDNRVHTNLFNASTTRFDMASIDPIEANRWYLYTTTIDASGNAVMYLDGVQQDTAALGSLNAGTGEVLLGLDCGVCGENWPGDFDDFRTYNYALTGAEVAGLYTDGSVGSATNDPFADKVVLLIQPDADDIVPEDLSQSAHSPSFSNGAAFSTAITDPFGGSNQVMSFDGNNDRLLIADSDDWHWDGDFTLEFWAYFSSMDGNDIVDFLVQYENGSNNQAMGFHNNTDDGIYVYNSSGVTWAEGTDYVFSTGEWRHVVFQRAGNDFTVFDNGTAIGTYTNSNSYTNNSASLRLMGDGAANQSIDGYVHGIRFTKGVARYTGDFTPPTTAYAIPPAGPPQYVAHTETSDTGTTVTVNKPTGLAEGDFLVFWHSASGNRDLTRTGWETQHKVYDGSYSQQVLTKIADAADVAASSYDFTASASVPADNRGFLMAYRGVSQTIPVAFANGGVDSSNPATFPSGFTTHDNSLLVAINSAFSAPGTPTGFTLRQSGSWDTMVADAVQLTAGATGTIQSSASPVSATFIMALNPADVTAGSTTNYFVRTNTTHNGDFGGLEGADQYCLDQLTANQWQGMGNVTINDSTVRAWLCDGSTCQNLLADTEYTFAKAGDVAAGGGTLSTTGRPGNTDAWGSGQSQYFNVNGQAYWTGRAAGTDTAWGTTSASDHCNGWTDGAGTYNGQQGRGNSGNTDRWARNTTTCSNTRRMICVVDFDDGSGPSVSLPTPTHQYSFDDGSGTTATDSIGSLNGTLTNGPTWVVGGGQQGDGALSLDASNDYVAVGDDAEWTMSAGKKFTYAAWVKFNSFAGGNWPKIFGNNGDNFGFIMNGTAGNMRLSWWDGSNDYLSPAQNLQTGIWYHVAVSVELGASNTSHWYLNGVDLGTFSPPTITTNPTEMNIGRVSSDSDYFDGEIDEVQIYDNTLTPAQAALLYSNGLAAHDPYSSSVVLLIQPDTDDTTIDDYSNSAHSITTQYDTALSTAVADPFGGSNQVIALDGAGDNFYMADSDDWHFNGDFTTEYWVYMNSNTTSERMTFHWQYQGGANNGGLWFDNSGNIGAVFSHTGGLTQFSEGADNTATPGEWHHFALTRQGNDFKIFEDGVVIASSTDASALPNLSATFRIGSDGGGSTSNWALDGYFGPIRYTKGIARYTTEFAPPQQAFPSVSTSAEFDGINDYLSQTYGGASDRRTFTNSFWMKVPNTTGGKNIWSGSGASRYWIWLDAESISVWDDTSGKNEVLKMTNNLNANQWYHVVVAVDTTQATAANRLRLYIDGTEVTAFDVDDRAIDFPQNYQTPVNAAAEHYIGNNGPSNFEGKLSEFYFIDGQQLTPSDFGFDDSGTWRAKSFTGSYGTNGFYLFSKFLQNGAMGTDLSGNGHDFTPTSMDESDYTGDSPP